MYKSVEYKWKIQIFFKCKIAKVQIGVGEADNIKKNKYSSRSLLIQGKYNQLLLREHEVNNLIWGQETLNSTH